MLVYSVIMFSTAVLLFVFGVLIDQGHTNLINCYREERVKDKPRYCRKISRTLFIFAAVLTVSGIMGLFGKTDTVALCSVGILMVGMIGGISRLFYVQKKYGGGVF